MPAFVFRNTREGWRHGVSERTRTCTRTRTAHAHAHACAHTHTATTSAQPTETKRWDGEGNGVGAEKCSKVYYYAPGRSNKTIMLGSIIVFASPALSASQMFLVASRNLSLAAAFAATLAA